MTSEQQEQGRWYDIDRDVAYDAEENGKRFSVRANADYLNALEAERDALRERIPELESEIEATYMNMRGLAHTYKAERDALAQKLAAAEAKAALADEIWEAWLVATVPTAFQSTVVVCSACGSVGKAEERRAGQWHKPWCPTGQMASRLASLTPGEPAREQEGE